MRTATSLVEEFESILVEFGQRHAEIEKLEIFGSFATGRATEESDLDVLVKFGSAAPTNLKYFSFFVQLQEELQELVGRRVDLIDRESLNRDTFSHNANLNAKVAYERS